MSRLTPEQTAVVDSKARLLAVDAFAGSGKTMTLVAYARARPRARMLYIAFNKSVAMEARERFPNHVDCRTTHSLAYAAVGKQYQQKLGNLQPFDVARVLGCATRRAKIIIETVTAWLSSTSLEITLDHVDQASCDDPEDAVDVVNKASGLWSRMCDLQSSVKMPHDGYLKLWALSGPKLRYDVILLDEAQDTNPVTLDLVLQQRHHAALLLVGDRHQGIYGFRGALNAMEAVDADERLALTQSFRFGQAIADVASMLLRNFKAEQNPVMGRADLDVIWEVDKTAAYTLIGRTNAGLFGAAASAVLADANKRLHFVGGFDSYLFGKVLDAYQLWQGERHLIKDQTIARFPNFPEFKKYGEEASDAEVKALVKVVEQYGNQVPRIYAAMKAAETADWTQAHITLTTAHRAKGLEWDQVYLADDFVELPPKEDFDPEEVNLLYVAVTRAIRAVRLPLNLVGWLNALSETPPGEDGTAIEAGQVSSLSQPDDIAEQEPGDWATDDDREEWLRKHAADFGNPVAAHICFLLQRLNEARLVMA